MNFVIGSWISLCLVLVFVALAKAEATEADGVPIEYLAHLAVVKGSIDGGDPLDLVVDTGAEITVLNSALVERLGLSILGQTEVGSPMGSELLVVDSLRIETLEIGGVVVSNVPALSMDLTTVFRGLDAPDAVLAATAFAGHLLTVDYPNDKLWLREGSLPAADGRRVLDYGKDSGVPKISVSVADRQFSVALDTGAPGSILLPTSEIPSLPLGAKPVVAGQGRTVDATFEILSSPLDGSVQIGDINLDNPTLTFTERTTQAHMGMSLLGNFALTIDSTNRRLRFDSPGQAVAPTTPGGGPQRRVVQQGGKISYGIQFAGLVGDALDVRGVNPDGIAERGGVKAGDRIVGMNGEKVQSLSQPERIESLRGSPLILEVARDGKTLELTLSKH